MKSDLEVAEYKMKILFITNMYPASNPVYGIFVKEQVEEIEKQVGQQDVYFINAAEKGNLQYLISIFAIILKIRKNSYDVIHIHYGLSGLFLLFYKPKAKIFLTLHGADILKKQGKTFQVFFTKRILRKVDKVFILNAEMESIVKPLQVNYEMLPCGVDIDFFAPVTKSEDTREKRLIVFPASPSVWVKNYRLFQEVVMQLQANGLVNLETACIQGMSREEVRNLLTRADCLLMTSVSEGSPQVIKEALSCGLPVVSVPVGDVSTLIEGVPHCYVSEGYDCNDLAGLVLQSFTDCRNEIRSAFLNKRVYDSQSVAGKIIENYRQALSA